MRLQAKVAERTLDNARAIAIGSDGRRYWAYLDASGGFSLTLPAGHSYRVLIANAALNAPSRVSGHVVLHTSAGGSRWIDLDGTRAVVDLGIISPNAHGAGGVKMQSDSSSADDDEHAGDPETHDDAEDEDDGETCTDHDGKDDDRETDDDDDVELHASKDPGDSCKDEHVKEHSKEDGEDEDDESDRPCPSFPSIPKLPKASIPGPLGSPCTVTAQCAVGLSCVGSMCVVPVR